MKSTYGIQEPCVAKFAFNAPERLAKQLDAIAGRRGRSRYLREALEEKLQRDQANTTT